MSSPDPNHDPENVKDEDDQWFEDDESVCCGAEVTEQGICVKCGDHSSTEKEYREYNEERKKEGL